MKGLGKWHIGLQFAIGLIFVSCSTSNPKDQGVFLYNEHSGITSLDPLYARNLANIWAVQWVYEGLTRLNSEDSIVLGLAESWTRDSSAMIWSFQLRKGVYFHPNPKLPKGYTLTSQDVVQSFYRARNHPFSAWILEDLDTLIAEDSHKIKFHFVHPKPDLLALLSVPALSILPAPLIEKMPVSFWRTNACGTGPFQFQAWEEGEKMVLPIFSQYWRRSSSYQKTDKIKGIAIQFVKELQSAKLDFLMGNLAVFQGSDPQINDELVQLSKLPNSPFRVVKGNFLNTEYLGFNLKGKHPVCHSSALRKALRTLLDVPKVITEVRSGLGEASGLRFCSSVLIPGKVTNQPDSKINQRQEAMKWLRKAGYNHPNEVPPLILHTDPAYAYFCSALIYPWVAEGFNVRLEVVERSTLKSMVAKGQIDFFRASWIADYPSAFNVLGIFKSNRVPPNGPNYTYFENDTVDAALHILETRTSNFERGLAIETIESVLMDHAPVIPLYFDAFIRFERKECMGLKSNSLNQLDAVDVYMVDLEAP
jgi:ABC-type transport system substrate-binding protein